MTGLTAHNRHADTTPLEPIAPLRPDVYVVLCGRGALCDEAFATRDYLPHVRFLTDADQHLAAHQVIAQLERDMLALVDSGQAVRKLP